MPSQSLTVDTSDGPMPAYQSAPEGSARGGIVVIQEAFGVTRHIERVTERLADDGWVAVAPSLFHRLGSPVFAYDDFAAVMPAMQGLTRAGVETDLAATFDHLGSLGFEPESQGIVGFCMGGSVAFYVAAERFLGAAVTFYGGGVAEGRFGYPPQLEMASQLRTPWLGLYGDRDQSIPVDQVEALRETADRSPVITRVIRYPDAEHGFNCEDRASYNQAAATDGWQQMLDWFANNMRKLS
jgi:carboxymethylenebutenolidase